MRPKLTFLGLAAALVFYFLLAGSRGVLLIREGRPVAVALGLAVLVLPLIGAWFLWRSYQFVRRSQQLGDELAAEGGLPEDELPRTPGGRVDREAADEVFSRRKAEVEAAPADWRCWFRLAIAYHDARDTPRARRAMQHAIALHGGRAPGQAGVPGGDGETSGTGRAG